MIDGSASLQAALNFTDADLAENRAGRMSAAQLARMSRGQKQSRVAMWVMVAVVIVFLIVIAVIFIPQTLAQSSSSSAIPPWIIAVIILAVALVMFISFARTRRGIRALTGTLLTVDGDANPKSSSFGDDGTGIVETMFRVHIGGVSFPVSGRQQMDAFEKGRRYRAYYVKSTLPVILSAERLD